MSIILKEEAANSVPTPNSGKATLFVDDNGTMSVKDDTGNVSTFPTVATSNTQVLFTDGSAIGGDSDFTWNKNTNVLTVGGNTNVGNVNATGAVVASTLTSNVANGTAPLTVTSQTVVTNLNADLLDGHNTSNTATANTVAVRNADGNLAANFFIGNGSQLTGIITSVSNVTNGTSNIDIPSANANIYMSVNGTANVVEVSSTGIVLKGDLLPSANVTYDLGSATNAWKDLHLAGNTMYIADETMSVNASTGIWSFSSNGANITLGTDSVFGNTVSANYFLGNGALLTGIDASGVQNGNSNVRVLANSNVIVSVAGNANIVTITGTGVNVAGTLNVTGNANVGNLGTTDLVVAGNMTTGGGSGGNISGANVVSANTFSGVDLSLSGNAVVGGNLTVNGNLVYVNVETLSVEDPIIELQRGPNGAAPSSNSGKDVGTALNYYNTQAQVAFMGWDVSNAEFGLASQVSISSEVVTFTTYGNLRVGNIIGNGQALTGLPAANISGQVANALVAGTVYTNAQPNITSVGTLGSLAVSGNANVGNIGAAGAVITGNVSAYNANLGNLVTANYVNVTNNLTVAGSANIGGGSGGNISGVNNLTANTLTGTLTTAAQPNITSIGTLSSLTVTNKVTAGQLQGDGGNISNIQGGNVSGTVSSATTAGTVTTNAQPNITSVGTLTSLTISGNLSAGNANLGNLVTANYVNIAADLTVSGNANIGGGSGGNISGVNNITANTFTGTLTTNAQPNITSVGTLSSLTVTGNVIAGNVSGGNLVTANYLAGTLTTAAQPNITSIGTLSSLTVTGNGTFGNVYANSGTVGASLLTGTLTTASQPNITSVGTLTSLSITGNLSSGNANLGNLVTANYVNVAADLNVSGNANIGGGSGGNISGVNNVTANTFTGTLTTNAQPNITSVGTLTSLGVNGTVTAVAFTANTGVFTGNGSGLSAITGGNVTGQVANALVAGTVYTNAQPNITSVGTLTSLAVTGNLSSGNANLGNLATANYVTIANDLTVTGNANIGGGTGGNISGVNNITANTFTGTLTTNAQPNITSVGTLSSLTVSGNVTAGNILGALANGNSNVNIPAANGNVNISAVGTANVVVVTATGINVAGTLNATGNANVGNIGATTAILTTGNITTVNTGLVQNGNSNITITSNGNISISATGTPNELVITSTGVNVAGTLNVTGNANVGNLGTTDIVVTGNANIGGGSGGNISGANNITANTFTGNLTTAAQPNITSVGTLTSLAVTGNVTAGNVYANSGTIGASLLTGTLTTNAQPNITSVGTLTSLSVTGNVAAGNLTTTGVLSVTGTGVSSIAGNLDMTSNTIINLATPTNPNDAATKQYVDDVAQGLHTHDSCNAATQTDLATISGGTVTYNNGSSGVGATLTTTGSYTTIDGVTLSNGMRILVKNEANTAHNGIYDRTSSTVLTRSSDFDTPAEMAGGDFTFVTAGTLYDNTGWVMTDPVTTVGTSPVPWVQFSGAGTYTAGTGLTLTGTVFSVNASQTQITSVGTLTSLTVSGNLSSGNANLGNLATANYVNVANDLNVTGNANIGGGSGGSLTGANNISANTFTSVVATGTAPFTVSSTTRVSNLNVAYANVADFMNVTTQSSGNAYLLLGNALTGNIAETANATFVANTSNGALYATTFIGALSGAATTAGTVTTAAQPNITSVGTLTSLGVNGTVTAVAFTANTGVFTGNGSGLTALNASNISSGTLAQARLANASVTLGNTALTLGSTVTTVAGLTSVTSTSFVGALTGAATTAGTVTTAAQPNITSVGTLSSLAVTGNITAGNLSVSTGTVTLGTLTTGGNTTAGTLTGNWSLSAGSRLQATYADLAEKYVADAQYDSGTVVLFGGELEVTISDEYDSHRVAGVVSTNPAYLMNAGCTGDHTIELALQGRVPVKVHGPVAKGDLMVSGPNGHAVANNMARAGTIIGKALENFEGGSGIIEVVVGKV